MTALDDLLKTKQAAYDRRVLSSAPKSYRPGEVVQNEDGTDTVTSHPTTEPNPRHDQLLRDHGYDPERDMIVGPINTRSWNVYKPKEFQGVPPAQLEGESDEDYEARKDALWKSKFYYHRFNTTTRPRGETATGVEELLTMIKAPDRPKRSRAKTAWADDGAFVHGFGDLQIGKAENPLSDLVPRFKENIAQGVELYTSRKGRQEHVHLPFLGDCIEGNNSQGGKNRWRTDLTMTEQVRALRRMMMSAIQAYAPHCKRLTVVSVPGNHDEAFSRDLMTRQDDSWAVEVLASIEDALSLSSEYKHVECYVPGRDQMTVTMPVGGATVNHSHGHQHRRGKHFEWLIKQVGHKRIGDTTITFRGHEHTGQYEEHGEYTAIAWPALETESVWFTDAQGIGGRPGTFALDIRNGHIDGLHRIR